MPREEEDVFGDAARALDVAAARLRGIVSVKTAALTAFLQFGDPASEAHLTAANHALRGAMTSLQHRIADADELEREIFASMRPPEDDTQKKKKKRKTSTASEAPTTEG